MERVIYICIFFTSICGACVHAPIWNHEMKGENQLLQQIVKDTIHIPFDFDYKHTFFRQILLNEDMLSIRVDTSINGMLKSKFYTYNETNGKKELAYHTFGFPKFESNIYSLVRNDNGYMIASSSKVTYDEQHGLSDYHRIPVNLDRPIYHTERGLLIAGSNNENSSLNKREKYCTRNSEYVAVLTKDGVEGKIDLVDTSLCGLWFVNGAPVWFGVMDDEIFTISTFRDSIDLYNRKGLKERIKFWDRIDEIDNYSDILASTYEPDRYMPGLGGNDLDPFKLHTVITNLDYRNNALLVQVCNVENEYECYIYAKNMNQPNQIARRYKLVEENLLAIHPLDTSRVLLYNISTSGIKVYSKTLGVMN